MCPAAPPLSSLRLFTPFFSLPPPLPLHHSHEKTYRRDNLLLKCGSFLIITSASSLVSAKVIPNLIAKCRVPSSNDSTSTICNMAPTTSAHCHIRNLGSLPASSISSSDASCVVAYFPEFNASVNVHITADNKS